MRPRQLLSKDDMMHLFNGGVVTIGDIELQSEDAINIATNDMLEKANGRFPGSKITIVDPEDIKSNGNDKVVHSAKRGPYKKKNGGFTCNINKCKDTFETAQKLSSHKWGRHGYSSKGLKKTDRKVIDPIKTTR